MTDAIEERPARNQIIDKRVEDGLRSYMEVRTERDQLVERVRYLEAEADKRDRDTKATIDRLGADVAIAKQGIHAAERREREVQARCDHYMKRVADLKARISIISSACLEAVKSAGDAMYEQPELGDQIDDGIKALAAKFGAGRDDQR